jgi:hypothetical protein
MNINPKIENLAQKIIQKANLKQDTYGIDPITIIIIIGVILSLIRVIQECRKDRNKLNMRENILDFKNTIVNLSIKDNWLNNYRLNRILKQQLTPKQYNSYGKSIKKAIMEVGKNLNDDESLTLLEIYNV